LITALTQSPSREGIQQTLSKPNFSAPGAEQLVRFHPSGDRNSGIQLVTIAPGNRSSFGFDFIPLPNYVMPVSDYLSPLPD
jgi:branched-chain amino acid transport system substrate-binding protein